ncbi:PTS glucitol/sorbitol transporter subunit IIA [Ligilactobacillus sp. LYQ135]
MIKTEVLSIGKQALNKKDNLVILFGPEVSARLKDVSVIQKIKQADSFKITTQMTLTIDDQTYNIAHVGELVENNFQDIHHTVLVFAPVSSEPRSNAIYLTPTDFPEIKVGSQIVIK